MGLIDYLESKLILVIDVEILFKSVSDETGFSLKTLLHALQVEKDKKGVVGAFFIAMDFSQEGIKKIKYPIAKRVMYEEDRINRLIDIRDDKFPNAKIFISNEALKKIDHSIIPPENSYFYYLKGTLPQEIERHIFFSAENQNLKKPEPQDQTELNRINTELEQAKATIQAKDEQIAELEKQLEQAKRAESAVKSDDNLEYVGNVPLNSNEEKLADFIDLLLELGSITNKQGLKPTYSELYTILDNKFRNRKKPSKNTIRKYMNKP